MARIFAPSDWFDSDKPEADVEPLAALPADEGDEEWAWSSAAKYTDVAGNAGLPP